MSTSGDPHAIVLNFAQAILQDPPTSAADLQRLVDRCLEQLGEAPSIAQGQVDSVRNALAAPTADAASTVEQITNIVGDTDE